MISFSRKKKEAVVEGSVISDLDKLIAEPIGFKFKGEVHFIKPISVKEFLKASEAMAAMNSLADKKEINFNEIVDCYYALIASVCDSISREDVLKMSQAQLGALVSLIMQTITGQAHVDEKKNTQVPRMN